ncbi:hypothetical protein HDU67_004793 [Dinochytrium kinnereticum]|nr:hypothetical protein HDU67_004793 [Dinochytrium kinnereticum]
MADAATDAPPVDTHQEGHTDAPTEESVKPGTAPDPETVPASAPPKTAGEEKAPSRPTTASGRPQPQPNKKPAGVSGTAPGSRTNSRNNLAKKGTMTASKTAVNTSKSQVISTGPKSEVAGSKSSISGSKSALTDSKSSIAKTKTSPLAGKPPAAKPVGAAGSKTSLKEGGAKPAAAAPNSAAAKPPVKALGSKSTLTGSKGALIKAEPKADEAKTGSRPASAAKKLPPSRPATTSVELSKENSKLKNENEELKKTIEKMGDEITSLRNSVETLARGATPAAPADGEPAQKHDAPKGSVDTLVDSKLGGIEATEEEAQEELQVLESIYGSEVTFSDQRVECRLPMNDYTQAEDKALIVISLPDTYPSTLPPTLEAIQIPSASLPFPLPRSSGEVLQLEEYCNVLRVQCFELFTAGEVVLYSWLDLIEQSLKALHLEYAASIPESMPPEEPISSPSEPEDLTAMIEMAQHSHQDINPISTVKIHVASSPITDRRSVFQGFCASVSTMEELDEVRKSLRSNGKIARCTHLIWAYRLTSKTPGPEKQVHHKKDKGNQKYRPETTGVIIRQDCDDDGEQAAGGRLLHLLQILDMQNVVVLVARWYGGVQLGPARFKHINQAARDVLEESGMLKKS